MIENIKNNVHPHVTIVREALMPILRYGYMFLHSVGTIHKAIME
jgi:hypothetical protein